MANSRQIRVPEEYYPMMKAFVEFLRTYKVTQADTQCDTQEEREKEKEPKRNKEKEEKKKKKKNAQAQENFSKDSPLIDAINAYYPKMVDPLFEVDEFIDLCTLDNWLTTTGEPITLRNVKAYMRGFKRLKMQQKKEKEEQAKLKLELEKQKQELYEKRKCKTNKSQSDKRTQGEERAETSAPCTAEGVGIDPTLSRREQVDALLAQKYAVDAGAMERMAHVVDRAVAAAGGDGADGCAADEADDRLDHLADCMGDNVVVSWIAKAILKRANHVEPAGGCYTGERVVADAAMVLKEAKELCKGRLTARALLEVLDDLDSMGSGALGRAVYMKCKDG